MVPFVHLYCQIYRLIRVNLNPVLQPCGSLTPTLRTTVLVDLDECPVLCDMVSRVMCVCVWGIGEVGFPFFRTFCVHPPQLLLYVRKDESCYLHDSRGEEPLGWREIDQSSGSGKCHNNSLI